MGNTVLVTGAAGFIGRRLCHRLQKNGARVIAVVRRRDDGPWHEFLHHDITNEGSHLDLSGVHTIFHLAGKAHALAETSQEEQEYFQANTAGTEKILEAAQSSDVSRFVLFSSVKVTGEGTFECQDETVPCHPRTPYGASKLAAERLVLDGGYVPEPVVLRLSMVYGNSEKGNLPRMIRAVTKGRFPPLPEVNNRRSMVHVDDVIQAAMLAAEKPEAINQIFNVTDGTPYSTRQMYEWICESLGKPLSRWSAPLPLLKLLAKTGDIIGRARGRRFMLNSDALDKLTGSACYSTEKIECQLGFSPMHHLRDSLPEMVRYLEEMKN